MLWPRDKLQQLAFGLNKLAHTGLLKMALNLTLRPLAVSFLADILYKYTDLLFRILHAVVIKAF